MRDAPSICVKEGDGMQLDGPVFDLESHADVQRVEIDVSVRQHYALRVCTCAAGVEELGQGIFVDGSDVGAMRCGCGEKSVVVAWGKPRQLWRAVKLDEHLYRAQIFAEGFDQTEKLLLDE